MNAKRLILWKPGIAVRGALFAACIALTLLVGYIHYLFGLAYEFHIFFSLPILLAAWFIGPRPASVVALVAVGLWFLADLSLGNEQSDSLPLLFNTAMRLVIVFTGVWLLAQLRQVLNRESRMAREDSLTGLPNRREFYEQGRHALALANRQQLSFAAMFIDLDKFKRVNDMHGHEAGDALLIRVADGLRAHVRAGDIVGRLGGDEFAMLLPGMNGAAAEAYAEELRLRLLDAMREGGWPVTFSIGVASYRHAPDDIDGLLSEADALMYEVKEQGRDHVLQREMSKEPT